jgi:hypothetical protein
MAHPSEYDSNTELALERELEETLTRTTEPGAHTMSTATVEKPEAKKELFDLSTIVKIEAPRRPESTFSMLLYGKPKVGKTLLAGSAADVEALSPILVLAIEDGSSVLANKYEDVDVVNIEDWKTAAAVISAVAEGNTKYKTVIVDTLGELQEQMVMHITKDKTEAMRIQDWGTILDNTVNVVKMLHRSPVNSIFITHADRVRDESTGAVMIQPVLKGKASLGEVPKIVDIIAYMQIAVAEDKSNVRVLVTEPTDKIDAGDRFGKLDSIIPNPTMQAVYDQLTAK